MRNSEKCIRLMKQYIIEETISRKEFALELTEMESKQLELRFQEAV